MSEIKELVDKIVGSSPSFLWILTGDRTGMSGICDELVKRNNLVAILHYDSTTFPTLNPDQIETNLRDTIKHCKVPLVLISNNYQVLKTLDFLVDEFPDLEVHWVHVDNWEEWREGKGRRMTSIGDPFFVLEEYAKLYDKELERLRIRLGGEK